MFEISFDLVRKVRARRAEKFISKEVAAEEVGISTKTFSLIESGQKTLVKRTVYEKLVNWLFSPDEMGG